MCNTKLVIFDDHIRAAATTSYDALPYCSFISDREQTQNNSWAVIFQLLNLESCFFHVFPVKHIHMLGCPETFAHPLLGMITACETIEPAAGEVPRLGPKLEG